MTCVKSSDDLFSSNCVYTYIMKLPVALLAESSVFSLLASISAQLHNHNRQTSSRAATYQEPPPSEVYLTIVFRARNDDYGGDMLNRFNNFLLTIVYLLEKEGVDEKFAEILVVEWNPPSTAGPLADELKTYSTLIPIRVVTVPKKLHDLIPQSKGLPLFE